MVTATHTMVDFEARERLYGHPALGLAPATVADLRAHNLPLPSRSLAIHLPPGPGQCGHCGIAVPKDKHLAARAVGGFEEAVHIQSGDPLRSLITHCDEHWRSDHCSRDYVSPGTGWKDDPIPHFAEPGTLVGPAGWCEPMPSELTLGVSLFPGGPQAARKFTKLAMAAAKVALAGMGLGLISSLLVTSQGQQQADFGGPLIRLMVPGDATAGHGFNLGLLRALSGAAPGSGASAANAAETGTLAISWVMNATAFGAATAATPSQTTANAIANVNASGTVTVGYARLVEQADSGFGLSTSLCRLQLTVGAGSGELSFNVLAIVSGGACSVTSFTITYGA